VLAHSEIVPSAVFVHKNTIVSGGFDRVLRMWDVDQRKVIAWHECKEFITALAYRSGRLVVGTMIGELLIYQCDGSKMKMLNTVDVKNRHGSFS
jgi:WD40 repeat protein